MGGFQPGVRLLPETDPAECRTGRARRPAEQGRSQQPDQPASLVCLMQQR